MLCHLLQCEAESSQLTSPNITWINNEKYFILVYASPAWLKLNSLIIFISLFAKQ